MSGSCGFVNRIQNLHNDNAVLCGCAAGCTIYNAINKMRHFGNEHIGRRQVSGADIDALMKGAEMAREVATSLRLDKASIQRITSLVYHHDDRTPPVRAKAIALESAGTILATCCPLTVATMP